MPTPIRSPRTATVLTTCLAAAAGLALTLGPGPAAGARPVVPDPEGAELIGFASLPADTFVPGSERSGSFTTNAGVPFGGQPVQGFSGIHALGGGDYLVMSDNGFGAKANSQDFQLRVHRITPDPTTGTIAVRTGGFVLSDPDARVAFPLWRDGACSTAASAGTLPAGYTCPARDRILTGWDFDLESMQVGSDGTFWFGEEFGPFLLHTDARGRLLEAPVPTPGVRSPSNVTLAPGEQANLANSKGFEGMAISPNGHHLYPMLEGPTAEDVAAGRASDLRIFEVRTGQGRRATAFTGAQWRYRLDSPAHAIGDLIAINKHQFLAIERDNGSGPTAVFKRIFLLDSRDRDKDGYVDKRLLVDLMKLPNPEGLGGFGTTFTFPYVTIEDVDILDEETIAVLNDNNYPATGGRGVGVKDVNEFLRIRLDAPLDVDERLLP
ncbi:MAG: esterase-like activity of phytase family protein [Nocardioides sp.]|nr:esterase-like activity of phytase family protein [Nocardioides sp.]